MAKNWLVSIEKQKGSNLKEHSDRQTETDRQSQRQKIGLIDSYSLGADIKDDATAVLRDETDSSCLIRAADVKLVINYTAHTVGEYLKYVRA